jgi:carboxyl-terminal processing protease
MDVHSKKSLFLATAAVLLIVVAAFWSGFVAYPFLAPRIMAPARPASVQPDITRDEYVKLSGEIYDTLNLQYYQKVDVAKLLKGQAAGLEDPYTELFTPAEAADFREELSGEYVGIGVVISPSKKADAIEIVRIFPGTPAEEAGLKPGDIIDSIDGSTARGLDLDQVSALVKGKAGTSVKLKIDRSGTLLDFTVVRRQVELPVVESRVIGKNVGYISVSSFSSGVAVKFAQALHGLESQKVAGLVIDLRDDGGGYLNECLDMLSNFIQHGTALWTKEAGGETNPVTVSGSTVSFPVVVLVNGNSASASEIFSAAMQENKVALVVGTKTYGKGLIQRSWDLSEGYELKVTVEEYYTPNKNTIQKKGLTPNVVVADPAAADFGLLPADGQLARAVQLCEEGKRP